MPRRAERSGRLSRLTAALLAAFAGMASLAAFGCAANQSGGLLEKISGVWIGAKPVRPGVELGMLYVPLHNTSKSTLTIQSIELHGPGIGRVVKVVEVKIERGGAPSSLYTVDPPAIGGGRHCSIDRLLPVRGYRLTPGSYAFIWIVVRAVRPGRWAIPAHVITYTAGGLTYQQSLGLRATGSVATDAKYIPVDPSEASCVGVKGVKLLAGYHLGK